MPRRSLVVFGLCLAACKSSEKPEPEPRDTSAVERIVALPRSEELPGGAILRTSRETDFESMRADLVEADIVYVNPAPALEGGERLPLAILDQLFGYGRLHGIALAVFDRTHQEALDEFSFGRIDLGELLARTGVPAGPRRPILEFAAERRLPLVALDLEAGLLASLEESGFQGLSEAQRRSISPATLRSPGFAEAFWRYLKQRRETPEDEPQFQRRLLAADLRYETMADAIVRWYRSAPEDAQLVVIADAFALANRHALPARVRRRTGKEGIVVVQMAASAAGDRTHNRAFADYVWLLPGEGE